MKKKKLFLTSGKKKKRKKVKSSAGSPLAGKPDLQRTTTRKTTQGKSTSRTNTLPKNTPRKATPKKDTQKKTTRKKSGRNHSVCLGATASFGVAKNSFPPVLPERFICEKTLGIGGLCAVFQCTDTLRAIWGDRQPSLAIKTLLPDYTDNPKANLLLMQEFCLTRQLAHPHIIRVYDTHQLPRQKMTPTMPPTTSANKTPSPAHTAAEKPLPPTPTPAAHNNTHAGTKGDETPPFSPPETLAQSTSYGEAQPYALGMTMELLKGPSLAELIHANPQGLGKAIEPLAQQLFSAIHYLHSQGIAHGDIKPANITLEANNRLVLFDFNTARGGLLPGFAEQAETQSLRADLRLKNFSPLYASPERIETGEPSLEDDIFTAAGTLFHLAYGARPYTAENALVARQKTLPIHKPLFLLPKAMHTLLRQSLALTPGTRPSSEHWLQTLGEHSAPWSSGEAGNQPFAQAFTKSFSQSFIQPFTKTGNLLKRLWPISKPHI